MIVRDEEGNRDIECPTEEDADIARGLISGLNKKRLDARTKSVMTSITKNPKKNSKEVDELIKKNLSRFQRIVGIKEDNS